MGSDDFDTPPMDDHIQTLQRCLRQHLPASRGRDIDLSTELVLLGLDSMSAISLLLDVEDAFRVKFPRSMLDPKVFRTGETLLAAIRQLQAQPEPPTAA